MAKKSIANYELDKVTEAATETQPEKTQGKKQARRPIGVYLRNDTLAALQDIAHENKDIPMHALIVYAVSYFIRQYRAGKVKIETETKTTLKTDI